MTLSIDALILRVKALEVAERELAERKRKRAVIQRRYRVKHADEIKKQKAAYYQSHKQEYAEAARRRRARYKAAEVSTTP